MASCYFLLLSLFVHLLPIYAQDSTSEKLKLVLLPNIRTKSEFCHMETKIQRPDVVSCRSHTFSEHSHHHLKNVHGILILVGWGTLLPIGAIIARFCREKPLKCNKWFVCHIMCQILGYVVGTIGWCIGIWLGSVSEHYVSETQRVLSIIAFTIINLQMLSIFVRPSKEAGNRKWWNLCHHTVGYVAIGVVIANIYAGINNESEAEKLKLAYLVIIVVLVMVAAPLQLLTWKSTINQQFLRMASGLSRRQSQDRF